MPFPSEVEKMASHFDVYVEELHEFLKTSRIPHGSARDVFPFADSVSIPGYLHDEMAALVRSFLFREGGAVPRTELVELIVAAVGGPNVDASAQELLVPVRKILAFVSTVVHSRWGIPRDDEEIAESTVASYATPSASQALPEATPTALVTDRARFLPDAESQPLPARTPRTAPDTFFRARALRTEPEPEAQSVSSAKPSEPLPNIKARPHSPAPASEREELHASSVRMPFQSESTFTLAPIFPAQLEPDSTVLPLQLPLEHISTLAPVPSPLPSARIEVGPPSAPRAENLTADLPFPAESEDTPAYVRVPFASTLAGADTSDEDTDTSPRRTSWLVAIGTILLLALLALLVRIVVLSIHSSRSAGISQASNPTAPVINTYAQPAANYVKPSSYGEPLPAARNRAVPRPGNEAVFDNTAAAARSLPGSLPVPSSIMSANLMSAPEPDYPRLARMAHIEGQVILKALISRNGNVIAAHVISGHHLLRGAATHAVYQRHYRPYILNGKPMQVSTIVFVDFNLP